MNLKITPNHSTVISMAKSLTSRSALPEAKSIHAHFIKHGFQSHPFSQTTLITMYSKCNTPCHAHQLFDEIPQRDTPTWNAFLSSLTHTPDHICPSLNLMRRSLQPDPTTFLTVFRAFGTNLGLKQGQALHCLALELGFLAWVSVSTSLIHMYEKGGDLGSARCVFDEIIAKDVVCWNAMISGCVRNKCFLSVVTLFEKMMNVEKVRRFDSTTLVIVVSALSHLGILNQGQVVHGFGFKNGMDRNCELGNALTDMYAKCMDLVSAESLFLSMDFRDTTSWNSFMGGCLFNAFPEKSLFYFREMGFSDSHADEISLSCVISACSSLRDLRFGESVHGWGIKNGYSEKLHLSFANALISLYSKCDKIESAVIVFEGLVEKDLVSWNSMIDGFVEDGRVLEVFDLLHVMQLSGMEPDSVTMVNVLPLCAVYNLFQQGRSMHGYIIRRELESDLSVTNSLMNMYSKSDNLKSAELLFKAMPERDLISFNVMIAGYSQIGCSRKKAWALFRELLRLGLKGSYSTLLAILPSCDCHEEIQFGESLHCWGLKSGFPNNIFAVNALMFMYMSFGDLVAACSLFSSISLAADLVSWNILIAGYAQNGFHQEAFINFNQMRYSDINPDSITLVNVLSLTNNNLEFASEGRSIHGFAIKTLLESDLRVRNALLTMYCRCNDTESAELLFDKSPDKNLCSWNCIISGFAQNKNGKRAIELFQQLEFEPNEITIVSILSACTQLGDLRLGRHINGYVFRFGLQQNPFISATLVDMYSKCGRLDIAVRIFGNSQDKSIASWNSMISAYGFHGDGKNAIKLFYEMCELGIKPTKSTFISLLFACSHSGLINEGQQYFYTMWDEFGVSPSTEHYVCMVDMLGRAGKVSGAYEFVRKMSIQAAPGVWGALLSACKDHGNLEIGKVVAEHLFSVEPKNAGYYISLSNMYAAAGRWEDVVEIRRMIRDRGLKKIAGCSLVDVLTR